MECCMDLSAMMTAWMVTGCVVTGWLVTGCVVTGWLAALTATRGRIGCNEGDTVP
jgi:hypothetical protein